MASSARSDSLSVRSGYDRSAHAYGTSNEREIASSCGQTEGNVACSSTDAAAQVCGIKDLTAGDVVLPGSIRPHELLMVQARPVGWLTGCAGGGGGWYRRDHRIPAPLQLAVRAERHPCGCWYSTVLALPLRIIARLPLASISLPAGVVCPAHSRLRGCVRVQRWSA